MRVSQEKIDLWLVLKGDRTHHNICIPSLEIRKPGW